MTYQNHNGMKGAIGSLEYSDDTSNLVEIACVAWDDDLEVLDMSDSSAVFKQIIENWVRPYFRFTVRSLTLDNHRRSYTLILHRPERAFSDRWFTVFAEEFDSATLSGAIPEYLRCWIQDELYGSPASA